MGITPIAIDDRIEVRVRDTLADNDGWHLTMALYVDGKFVDGNSDASPVADLDEGTLSAAAWAWWAERGPRGGVPVYIPYTINVAGEKDLLGLLDDVEDAWDLATATAAEHARDLPGVLRGDLGFKRRPVRVRWLDEDGEIHGTDA